MNGMPKPTEQAIIRLLQQPGKKREAFEMLVTTYREQVYWQIRRMVLSHDDADDVMQETFIRIWTHLDTFRQEAKLSTWIYRIALNECLAFLNKQRLQNNISLDDAEGEVLCQLESDPWFDGDLLQCKLQQAIQTLPDKQRFVFNQKYFDGKKYEEIAQVTGVTVGALKASYHHAVKKIQAFLEKDT